MAKKDKKPKKRANIAVNIQSSSEEDIRRLPPAQKKRAREDYTSSPEGQQDKRPAMEGQTEDKQGEWLKATLEDRGVGELFESISGMVNKVLEKQRFVPWYVLSVGRFFCGMFCPWDVLRFIRGTFCP